jgi:type IV secretion system protein VirB10
MDEGAVHDDPEGERGDIETANGEREVDGSRGVAEFTGARRPWPVGARTFFVVTGLVMAAIVTVLLVRARRVHQESETRRREPAATERIEKRVPDLKLAAPMAVPARAPLAQIATKGDPTVPGAGPGPQGPSEAELVQQRRLARGFGGMEGESGGTGASAPPPGATAVLPGPGAPVALGSAPGRGGGLEEKLEAMELKAASAGVLPDRDYLLTQGAMLDCVLETKVVSTVAGMASCHLTRDIYSANGHVVLLDRGSKVVGRYQGGIQQGETRIFVLWTRVETPAGVVVELDSPGTGALGEAGLGGWADTHFWDRFGAAILLSIIQDGTAAAAARAAGPGQNTSITLSNQAAAGKEVVARSLEPTINIPPTIYKNQGERVGIFVARDLDFRSVYGLERSARAER